MEIMFERCAGLDVGKAEVVACIRVPNGAGGRRTEVRTFATFTSRLEALAERGRHHRHCDGTPSC